MKNTNFVKYEPKEVHIRERHGDFYIVDLSKLIPDGTTTSTEEEEHSGADIISCTPFNSEFRKRIQYKVVQQNYSYKHLTKWYDNFYDAYKSALKYAAKRGLTVIYNEEHDKHGDAREIMHRMHHGAARDKYMQEEYDKITPREWNEYYAQLREEREERDSYENTDFTSWDSDSGL